MNARERRRLDRRLDTLTRVIEAREELLAGEELIADSILADLEDELRKRIAEVTGDASVV